MPHKRAWVSYIEGKYRIALTVHRRPVDLEDLTATQTEIERIKYELVRHEALRAGEPILAYAGRWGECFVIDGHTRARVQWDLGAKTIEAMLYTSAEIEVDAELHRIALDAGGGQVKRIWQVPILDRLGKGTEAWEKYRTELLDAWRADQESRDA